LGEGLEASARGRGGEDKTGSGRITSKAGGKVVPACNCATSVKESKKGKGTAGEGGDPARRGKRRPEKGGWPGLREPVSS